MKTNLVGQIVGSSGYARHTRELALALYRLGVDVGLECNVHPNQLSDLDSKFVDMLRNDYRSEHNIFIDQLHILPVKLCEVSKSLMPYVIFEGDRIPKHWVKILNDKRISKALCPSNHVIDACINSGVSKNKLILMPHGVDLNIFKKTILNPKYGHLIKNFITITSMFFLTKNGQGRNVPAKKILLHPKNSE